MEMEKSSFGKVSALVLTAILLLPAAAAASLSIDPTNLNFRLEPGERKCKNITVLSESYRGKLEGEVFWAEEGENTTDLEEHKLSSEQVRINLSLREEVEDFTGRGEVELCVRPEKRGFYHGAVYYKAVSGSGNVGVGIGSWITVDSREKENNTLTGFIVSRSSELATALLVIAALAGGIFIGRRGGKD